MESKKMTLHADRTSCVPDRVLFGAAYYAEYQLTNRLDEDLDLMVEANFTVIRVGESVWSTWEPRDGEFDLDWLQPVLDGAHARGISVILGTPTYAVPPWLQQSHPEIAAHVATGKAMPWGSRQEIDYSAPAFLFYAERLIRKIIERYADHPAIIGYQVDNEPGLLSFHNPSTFRRFVRRLKEKYGTVTSPQRLVGAVDSRG
jgi:beta-galactosidase